MRRLPLTVPAIALGAAGLLLLSTAPAFAADDDVYTIIGTDRSPQPDDWYFATVDRSDPSSVIATAIGTTPMPHNVSTDGVEIVDGVGYLITLDSTLVLWDPITGELTGETMPITGAAECYSLTATPTGALLTACEGDGWGVGSIDLDTGAFTPLVMLHDDYQPEPVLATDPITGITYAFVYTEDEEDLVVIRLDLDEGTSELLGPSPFSRIWAADFDSEGTLWVHASLVESGGLLAVDDVGDDLGDWTISDPRTYVLGDDDIQPEALALGDGIVDSTAPDEPDDAELAETGSEFGGAYWAMSIGGIALLAGAVGLAIARVRVARRG